MARLAFVLAVFVLAAAPRAARATPPLVTGEVPTVGKGRFHWFTGFQYQEQGAVGRQAPLTDFLYGITRLQELKLSAPFVTTGGHQGFGDVTLGAKTMVLQEADAAPMTSASFEAKLPNADESKGLGSGSTEYDFRLRSQKTLGRLQTYANLAYTRVGDVVFAGATQRRSDVLFASLAHETRLAKKWAVLSELLYANSPLPGQPNQLSASLGFKFFYHQGRESIFGSVAKSLREGNVGGPRVRFYWGLRFIFGGEPQKDRID